MLTGYTKSNTFVDPDAGKSLYNDFVKCCREALCLKTPLEIVLDPSEIAAHIYGISQSDKIKHLEFISDIKATKAYDLWPESNGILPQNCNIATTWQAINIFFPRIESYSIENHKEVQKNQVQWLHV